MLDWIREPWPWYIAGPLIGLTAPALLLLGNKAFGISSTLRDICAACIPARVPLFQYDWKTRSWNLFFVLGIVIGAFITQQFLSTDLPVAISEETVSDLRQLGITNFSGLAPVEIFAWDNLLTGTGLTFIVLGGFLVGFGTRYAGGCTSGHTMFGLSYFQLASLVASISFFAGGLAMTHLIFPLIF